MSWVRIALIVGGAGLAAYVAYRLLNGQSIIPGTSAAMALPPAPSPGATLLPGLAPNGDAAMQPSTMQLDTAGVAFIKSQEQFSPVAYRDAGGYSIGYGYYGAQPGQQMTQQQADAMFPSRVAPAVLAVRSFVTVQLTQGQFNALVDFAYNVGAQAFRESTLLRLLNSGDVEGAEAEFSRWTLVQGQRSTALADRRAAEVAMFTGDVGQQGEA